MSSAAPTIEKQQPVVGETEATKKFMPLDDEVTAVRVRGLGKRYRDGTEANRGIDLDVRSGEIRSILGPNGAGRTTVLRQITRELRPTSGSIEIFGVDAVARPRQAGGAVGVPPHGAGDVATIT